MENTCAETACAHTRSSDPRVLERDSVSSLPLCLPIYPQSGNSLFSPPYTVACAPFRDPLPLQVRSRTLDPLQNTDRPTSSQHCEVASQRPILVLFGCKGKIHPSSREMEHLCSSLQPVWMPTILLDAQRPQTQLKGVRVRHRVSWGIFQQCLRSLGLWNNVLIQ